MNVFHNPSMCTLIDHASTLACWKIKPSGLMDPTRPEVSKSQMSCAACRLHGYITSLVVDFSGLSDNNLRSEPSPDREALLVEPGATSE